MSRSDWLVLALNLAALLMGMVGLAAQHTEPMTLAILLGTVALIVNSVRVLRRRDGDARPTPVRRAIQADELDAATVLDLDARLEALEQAQLSTDAAQWRALVASGQISGPAAGAPSDGSPTHTRNGERS